MKLSDLTTPIYESDWLPGYLGIGHDKGSEMWFMDRRQGIRIAPINTTLDTHSGFISDDSLAAGRIDHKQKLISLRTGEALERPEQDIPDRIVNQVARFFNKNYPGYAIVNYTTRGRELVSEKHEVSIDYTDIGHDNWEQSELWIQDRGKPIQIIPSQGMLHTHWGSGHETKDTLAGGRIDHKLRKISVRPSERIFASGRDLPDSMVNAIVRWFNRKYPGYSIVGFDFNNGAETRLLSEDVDWSKKIPRGMTDEQRHDWLRFIWMWLSGQYMGDKQTPDVAERWKEFARIFPPKVKSVVPLYRLVTVPLRYAEQEVLSFKPAPGRVGSWSQTMTGIDAVMGVATDQGSSPDTARLAIQANIPGQSILATPSTIKAAFLAMSHDYFDRYPEVEHREPIPDEPGRFISRVGFEGWPEEDQKRGFDPYEIGFIRSVYQAYRGGFYRQYEVVVETPPQIEGKVVRVYRLGNKVLNYGNDDPHN